MVGSEEFGSVVKKKIDIILITWCTGVNMKNGIEMQGFSFYFFMAVAVKTV